MKQHPKLEQILKNPSISTDDKIEQLKKLKYELELLAVATEENMPDLRPQDQQPPDLRQVVLALESLGYFENPADAK